MHSSIIYINKYHIFYIRIITPYHNLTITLLYNQEMSDDPSFDWCSDLWAMILTAGMFRNVLMYSHPRTRAPAFKHTHSYILHIIVTLHILLPRLFFLFLLYFTLRKKILLLIHTTHHTPYTHRRSLRRSLRPAHRRTFRELSFLRPSARPTFSKKMH